MNPALTGIDTRGWEQKVRRLMAAKGISGMEAVRKELKDAAGLVMRDAYAMTPPFGKSPVSEIRGGGGTQQKIGQGAVARDIRNVFLGIGTLIGELKRTNPAAVPVAVSLIKAKNFTGLLNFLRSSGGKKDQRVKTYNRKGRTVNGYKRTVQQPAVGARYMSLQSVAGAPDANGHKARRGANGRVNGNRPTVLVSNEGAMSNYIKMRQQQVGKAKSGFAQALRGLKRGLLKWTKQGGAGVFQIEDARDKFTITAGNAVGYIQGTARQLSIIRRAFENQGRALDERIKRAALHSLKKVF